jgi:hypothetical protein
MVLVVMAVNAQFGSEFEEKPPDFTWYTAVVGQKTQANDAVSKPFDQKEGTEGLFLPRTWDVQSPKDC